MTPHGIVEAIGSYGGAFVVGAISSLVPFVSIDLFLVGITLAAGTSFATTVPIVLLAAAGQLAGKLPIYAASRGAAGLGAARRRGRHRARFERLQARLARWQRTPKLILALSAVLGLPPFSVMSTAAAVLAVRLRAFCAIVLAGRAARFAIVIAITALAAR